MRSVLSPRMARSKAPWNNTDRRIASVVLPVLCIDLSLQLVKLIDRFTELAVHLEQMGTLDWLLLIASPLLFHTAFALLCSALVLGFARGRFAWAGVLLAQLFALFTLLDQLASYSFFMHTSAPLGFEQVRYWLARPHDLALTAAVVSPAGWLGVLFAALALLLLPWLVARKSSPLDSKPGTSVPVLVAAALLAGGLGFLPLSSHAADLDAVRDPTLQLLASAVIHQAPPAVPPPPRILEVARASSAPPLNVVIVLLESTRAISVEPWGSLPTMPTLAALAKDSLIATRAYTVLPHTSKALIATLCGIDPSHSLDAIESGTGMLARCLPALLGGLGYHSAFFQAADPYFEGRESVMHDMGFELFSGATRATAGPYVRANFVGFEDDVMLEPSRRWLTANANAPKLAVYLTVAPHHECYPLTRYGRVDFDPRDDVNNYLNNVREEDFFIKNLLEQYRQLGLAESTIFVILGDHGEAFGEHGRRAHDSVPYEETMRIPLLIHDPTAQHLPPGVLSSPVSELDLVPTLLDALGVKITAGKLGGFPFGQRPTAGPVFASCFGQRDCLVDIHGTRKLITFYGRRPDELYDLASDPEEHTSLLGPSTEAEAQAMREELQRWEQRVRLLY